MNTARPLPAYIIVSEISVACKRKLQLLGTVYNYTVWYHIQNNIYFSVSLSFVCRVPFKFVADPNKLMFHISLSKPLGATYDQKVEGSTLISSFG